MADFRSALDQVRDELFLDRADGRYLDVIGENHGVFRPRAGIDDETWRKVLRLVLMAPKTVQERFEALFEALIGNTVAITYTGDLLRAPPDLRVEVLLDSAAPPASTPFPPAIAVRLTGHGLPADAPAAPGPGTLLIQTTGVQVGTPGSVTPLPAPAPEVVVARATGGQTSAQLRYAPVLPDTVELWINPHTPAVPNPVRLPLSAYGVDPAGRVAFDVLPSPLTFFAADPATGAPVPRPGLPTGAEVLAAYRIDTRTYAGLAAALRLKLPPVYRVEVPAASLGHRWTDLAALDRQMTAVALPVPSPSEDAPARFARLVRRIDLRSWCVHDVGRALGPPDAQPTTPFLDQSTPGPRVFVDLRRRDDLTHPRADLRQASYLHDDFLHPPPVAVPDRPVEEPAGEPWQPPPPPAAWAMPAPQVWEVHPWNRSADRARLRAGDPAFPGPFVYTHDERIQPCGFESTPGDPRTWTPYAEEFTSVLVTNPRTGQAVPVVVRQDRHATNPFSGAPLEATPGSGVLYRDQAVPLRYQPRADRGDHPLVLFSEAFWTDRLAELIDLVRAAGVFVTFERSPARAPSFPPPWFCDGCYTPDHFGR